MITGERFKDELEQAEEWAEKIGTARDGGAFPRVGIGGRGILQVFLSRLRGHDLRLRELERKVGLIDPEKR